jgi:hypothetical protein
MIEGVNEDEEMAQIINLADVLRAIRERNPQESDGDFWVLNTSELGSEVNARIGQTLLDSARSKEQITIRMPSELVAITPTFLEAMFGESIKEIRSPEEFRRVFHIAASIEVSVQVVRAVEAILMARGVQRF